MRTPATTSSRHRRSCRAAQQGFGCLAGPAQYGAREPTRGPRLEPRGRRRRDRCRQRRRAVPVLGPRGFYSEGREWLRRVLEHGQRLSPPLKARVLMAATALAVIQGDFTAAAAAGEEAASLSRASGDLAGLSHALQHLGSSLCSSRITTRRGHCLQKRSGPAQSPGHAGSTPGPILPSDELAELARRGRVRRCRRARQPHRGAHRSRR